jgi:hypothetical protein
VRERDSAVYVAMIANGIVHQVDIMGVTEADLNLLSLLHPPTTGSAPISTSREKLSTWRCAVEFRFTAFAMVVTAGEALYLCGQRGASSCQAHQAGNHHPLPHSSDLSPFVVLA